MLGTTGVPRCAELCFPCCMQMATAPEAIEFFMALFCNTTRIVLLMEKVPWKLLVQVSTAGLLSAHHAQPQQPRSSWQVHARVVL